MDHVLLPVRRIVSGGQTGADRGGLDAAIALGMEQGGWCPLGRRAEDGPIPPQYDLQSTDVADYTDRTRRNVLESDGTLIFCRDELSGGTRVTYRCAVRNGRPCHLVRSTAPLLPGSQRLQFDSRCLPAVATWLLENQVQILNIAGPRESLQPGIAAATKHFLLQLFA
jgi:hypothetical protein